MDDTQAIASRVRGIRAEHSLTQPDLGSILGIDRKSVGARLNGHVPFTATEILRLSNALARPIVDFFPQATPAPPPHSLIRRGEGGGASSSPDAA